MRHYKPTLAVMLIVLSVACVFADVIPGRWDKVANLGAGTPILVEMHSGDTVRGRFLSITDESLAVEADTGNGMTLPKSGISRVLEEKKGRKNSLLGAAIGAGAGVATGVAISASFDETFFARADLMALTCGAIGALTGALIGNSIGNDNRQEVVYRSR